MINLVIFLLLIFVLLTFIYLSLIASITSKNPIFAILYLILFFFNVCVLFILFGADYMGILFLIIYAGAISIVFLFVVMFLDLKEVYLEKIYFSKFSIAFLLMLSLFTLFDFVTESINCLQYWHPTATYIDFFMLFYHKSNIEAIGLAFYEKFLFQFLILGFLLFLVMILVISLLINYNFISKKQIIANQLYRKPYIYKTK